jgi:hypothetical protein
MSLVGIAVVLAVGLSSRPGAAASRRLSEAAVVFADLHSSRDDNDTRDLKRVERALKAVGCDLTVRMALPGRAVILPVSSVGQRIGFKRAAPTEGLTFVVKDGRAAPQRVWVVLSSVAPERTTVFWLDEDFKAGLVYDSFKKGEIRNAPHTAIAAVLAVTRVNGSQLLLEEWAEPGSRPGSMGAVGRVFQLDLTKSEMTLAAPEHLSGRP